MNISTLNRVSSMGMEGEGKWRIGAGGAGCQHQGLRPHAALLEKWVRVLASECIKRLCPVYFHSKGMEYVIALTAGKNEGYFHFGTITGKERGVL